MNLKGIDLLKLLVLLISVLVIGTLGFIQFADLSFIDALHTSSLYASGLGPSIQLQTTRGKAFSTLYALIAGLFFVAVVAFFIQNMFTSKTDKNSGNS